MRLPVKRISFSLLFLAVLGISFTYAAKDKQDDSNKAPEVKTFAVNVALVKEVNLPEIITAVGHIDAIQQVDLSFNSDGHLKDKYFKNGDRVLKGEIIAKLDDAQDLADLKALQAKLSVAEQDARRAAILVKSQAVSKEYVEQKNAALVEAQAEVEKQEIAVDHKKILAPFTGVLGSYKYDAGAYMSSGKDLVQLTQEAPLKVAYSIPANNKPLVETGNEVTLTTSAYPKDQFSGIVNFISPTINSSTGTLDLQANIPNKDYLLSPGMFVSVVQVIRKTHPILTLPETAIQTNQGGNFVWGVQENNTVKQISVKVGHIEMGWAQLTEGVKKDEKIVVIGGDKLADGDKITISDILPPKESSDGRYEKIMKAYVSTELKKNEKNVPTSPTPSQNSQ